MTIRDSAGIVALQITVFPPKAIFLDKLRFNRFGYDVAISESGVRINGITIGSLNVSNCGGAALALG
jgi:hypothetical protein